MYDEPDDLSSPETDAMLKRAVLASGRRVESDELAALRRDAERYRWLRDKASVATWDKPVVCEGSRSLGDAETFLCGDSLDAAVDAAMAA